MPVPKALERVGQIDLIAALPPGLYLFVTGQGLIAEQIGPGGLWQQMLAVSASLKDQPWSAVFVLFVAFLLGSLVRAIPLNITERLLPHAAAFPYALDLAKVFQVAQGRNDGDAPAIGADLTGENLQIVFNLWKDSLALRHPEAFLLCQAEEARSRFFAGMFWAGFAGLVFSIALGTSGAHTLALQQAFVSLVIVMCFGVGLPRVRKHEALFLFGIYLASRELVADADIIDMIRAKPRRPADGRKPTGGG